MNARPDRKTLHKAECEAVSAMVAGAYPKMFFDTYEEAREWLNYKFGESAWENCGRCDPN